jgi:hypothetical protein
MADSALQFLNDYDEGSADEQTLVVPEQPVTQAQPVEVDSALDFLNKQDATTDVKTEVESLPDEEPEEVLAPEDDPKYVEYYAKRLQPVPDGAVPFQEYIQDDRTRLEKTREEFSFVEDLSEEELEYFGDVMTKALREGESMRGADPISFGLSYLPPKTLLKIAETFSKIGAGATDQLENALTQLQETSPMAFTAIDKVVAGGRYAETKDPAKLADDIADIYGTAGEFLETVPAVGTLMASYNNIINTRSRMPRNLNKGVAKEKKEIARANRYNPKGAELATMETAEQARIAAREAAEANRDISNQLIREFEEKTGKTISKEQGDNLVLDPDLAREAGRETAREITERDGDLFDLALGDDVITSPILSPDKFDGIVAIASDLKRAYPESFNNNKTVIDNLFELTVNKDLIAGQELIDSLNKYGLSFEDYVLTVVGSGSDAGRLLQKLGQIKRVKPKNVADADDAAKKAREAGDFRKGVMRVENIRRGLLVSQIATAARNLTSGVIRAPMEGLGNVMDSAIYAAQKKGPVSGALELFSGDNWSGSFSNMKYMFSRPDVAKGYTDLILGAPELSKQFDNMFNNINEIQKLTGRGTGTKLDKVMSGMEDVVDVLNTPNRWQEYLIRRGQFFGELERLVKREYDVDLIDTLNEGKLQDLLNDASTIRPEGSPSFVSLVDDAVTKALDVTYAKQPEIPVFRSVSSFITRNGLTTIMPFPRFMFNSMELMGQYAGGASIPLTRKMASVVMKGQRGPLTSKDRQRITRNLMGMAAVGAAYWYRSSENAPPEYNQVAVGTDAQMDTTPTYPMAHFLYLGEATKRMGDGTFDDWFDSQEFVELFTGSNFRTGVGNSILEEVAQMADATDLTAGAATGRALGRTLGNYLSTWAVPFGQIIDAQRAAGVRGTEYKDVASDPTLDFGTTFKKEVTRSLKQRGIGVSAEEEAAAPKAEYPFYPEGRERLRPESKFIGATITNRASEDGEYLMRYGFDWRDFGSRSKVPSIKRFETKQINNLMPTIVESARKLEEKFVREYEEGSDVLRNEFTVEEYVSNKVRPYIQEQVRTFKSKIREGSVSEGDDYTRALQTYSRVPSNFRKLATTDFVDRYDRVPDPQSSEDLQKLIAIAKAYRETY